MKLKKLLLTAACIIMPLSAWAGESAFINSAIILQNAPQAVAASAAMKEKFQKRELDLRALLTEVQEMEKRYNKEGAIMSADKRKSKEDEIIAKKREFRFNQQSLKEDVQAERKTTVRELQVTISTVIRAYGKKKGYDFIFSEGVAYADQSVDITNEILEELKNK